MVQVALFEACLCGAIAVKAGRCGRCYAREWHDRRRFDGLRREVLDRDGECRGCGGRELLIVHHRSGANTLEDLITLCAGCHARVHRLLSMRYWMPALVVELWAEQHPQRPVQLQLAA